ncbi:MAG TPA: tetraacyldisaccharide 4'-kinase [Gammaproteobacteria bacterium]|nr:tetraacyldisaccharide 4'-kinase [Gammaproteobacteria bacterium]
MNFWWSRHPLAYALLPLAALFCAVVAVRRRLYDRGIKPVWQSPVPVVVVGNITVGGTGKTPVVIALIEALRAQGYRPGVVSRGYGGARQDAPLRVSATTSATDAGDEPVLIHRRTNVPVCVFADRVAAAKALIAQTDCNVIISDDGLQHYRLGRHFEVAVVDGTRRHGNGFCLPAGPLREPVARLEAVDFVLYNGPAEAEGEAVFHLQPEAFCALGGGEAPLDHFAGRTVHAIAGTASPQRFFASLEALGVKLRTHVFPDHHRYQREELVVLRNAPLLMTEKDAVKCQAFDLDEAWYLRVGARLPPALIDKLSAALENFPHSSA